MSQLCPSVPHNTPCSHSHDSVCTGRHYGKRADTAQTPSPEQTKVQNIHLLIPFGLVCRVNAAHLFADDIRVL